MPGRRCVVYGCSNISNPEGGISVHISPASKSMRDKWLRFVRTHRVNFSPTGRFVVCSDHFNLESFERSFHVEGSRRTLRPGSFPTIWRKLPSQEPSSSRRVRTRRKVKLVSISTCSVCLHLFWCTFRTYYDYERSLFSYFASLVKSW